MIFGTPCDPPDEEEWDDEEAEQDEVDAHFERIEAREDEDNGKY
jgi:hypothetical protein